jgi:hypothetical protein
MELREEEIAYKRKVGKLGNAAVIEVGLKGGLHLIFAARNGRFETLGAGPHRAVARFIAKKREERIEYTDLQKSDYVDPDHFSWLVPRYEAETDRRRAMYDKHQG